MKKLLAVMIVSIAFCSAQADNLFQNTNPFPQTMPQDMNNIYESKPAVMQDEAKKAKKSWFKRGENLQKEQEELQKHKFPVYPVPNEGQSSGNYYMFTTGQ